jgi:hypothetical protein
MPFTVALGISIGHSVWRTSNPGFPALMIGVISALFVALVYWGIYRLNQYAVQKSLEPRRQGLETLLAGLNQ